LESCLLTGGAGFIGSHLLDSLLERGMRCVVVDNLSSGSLENIKHWLNHPRLKFFPIDLLDFKGLLKVLRRHTCDTVFHLAANPEVRVSSVRPQIHFQQNVVATYHLLEAIREVGGVQTFIFTSSSTVYGEAEVTPTPESYSPLMPISVYGASKLACEALITSYAHLYGFRAIIYRLANIVGSRSKHGVIVDFIHKLRNNPNELEILGDGTQAKSYLHVNDCIEAMLLGAEKSRGKVEIFNIGSEDRVDVKTIAKLVIEEMNLKNVRLRFTGGVDGGRGWKGDVKYMLLDINKLKSLGWKPKYNSLEAIRLAIKEILNQA